MQTDFSLGKKELKDLRAKANEVVDLLRRSISEEKIDADVFIGGSLAKGTLVRPDERDQASEKFSGSPLLENGLDVDVFVRFEWKYEDLSFYLEKIVKSLVNEGWRIEKIHGSRDYFRAYMNKGLVFEIIPVLRIKKPREARNVTDLSYFHVNYVKKKLKKNNEVLLAKKFCKAHGFYGAESYIGGFSGYGLECLIINYGTFEKMLKNLVKVKDRGIILDPARHYIKKDDVLFELNESKLHSPIILIDPTWKERNVLAALNMETFRKFQETAKRYLKRPSAGYFEAKKIDISKFEKKAKQKKAEFVHIVLETDRQEGDIAGTKMKKFSRFLEKELGKYFNVLDRKFVYGLGQKADVYFVLKSKKEIIRIGPSLKDIAGQQRSPMQNRWFRKPSFFTELRVSETLCCSANSKPTKKNQRIKLAYYKKNVRAFKTKNKRVFEKNGLLYARIKVDFSGKEFLRKFDKKIMGEMGISGMEVR